MDTLKMKFKLNTLEFELEGNETTVKEEFTNFKLFITNELLPKINFTAAPVAISPQTLPNNKQISSPAETSFINSGEYPVLKEVERRELPKTETDWILIYGFYISSFGENTFTEKDIRSKYAETKRNSTSNLNNVSNNISRILSKGYLKMPTDTDYRITNSGIEYAKQILQGNSTAKTIKRTTGNSKNEAGKPHRDKNEKPETKKVKISKTKESISIDKSLNLREKGKKSFKEFYEEKQPVSAMDFNTVTIYYLSKELELDKITASQVYTCYKEVGKRPPEAFFQSLRDTASKNGNIDTGDTENIKLTTRGENHVEFDMPKKNG